MRTRIAVSALLVLVSGCSSSGSPADTSGAASSSRHAAEPATAPSTSKEPAGTVRKVADNPEGIVYDARTDTLAVTVHDPARLLLLDPDTLAIRHTVALPGTVRHLQLAAPGGPVLVPDETSAQLIEVSLPDGTTRATKVGKQPHDAAGVAGGEIVVGNEFGKSISFLKDGKVLQTVPGPQQPGGIIGDANTVGVIDVKGYTLATYDVATRKRLAIVNAGQGPTHGVLVNGNRFVVADTRGNQMLVFSVDPLKQIGRLDLPGAPYGIAVDGDTVWVTLTDSNELVGLDVSGDTPKEIARYPTVRQPNTVAVAPGSRDLWITGTADGTIERIRR